MEVTVDRFTKLVKTLPREELIHPRQYEEELENHRLQFEYVSSVQKMDEISRMDKFSLPNAKKIQSQLLEPDRSKDGVVMEGVFPCLLVVMDGPLQCVQVNADGTSKLVDESPIGGGTMTGLSSLLANIKNNDDLDTVLAKGDSTQVDLCVDHVVGHSLTTEASDDGAYAGLVRETKRRQAPNNVVFHFGLPPHDSRGILTTENLSAAVLEFVAASVIHSVQQNVIKTGVNNIFFCGRMLESPACRSSFVRELTRRRMFIALQRPHDDREAQPLECHFLKHSTYQATGQGE